VPKDKRIARDYMPVVVDAATLQALRAEEVFVCRSVASSGAHECMMATTRGKEDDNPSSGRRNRFFRNVLYPDIPLALSQAAQRFFSEEHFEMAYLQAAAVAAAATPSSALRGGRREMKDEGRTEVLPPTCPFSRVRDVGEYGPLA